VSKILNEAFELGDNHPAKYFLARCVLRALADFVGYMADDDLRADRLRVAELFVVLPQFARQWAYHAEVVADARPWRTDRDDRVQQPRSGPAAHGRNPQDRIAEIARDGAALVSRRGGTRPCAGPADAGPVSRRRGRGRTGPGGGTVMARKSRRPRQ
jgi:hypothetical protein